MNRSKSNGEGRPGEAVDAQGGPVVDPTKNVLQLVEAAVTRLNDLRESDSKWLHQLQDAEARRIDEQLTLRADFADKLTLAESKRIDAIRAVDVSAVAVASERATQQASVLANQVVTSADALRSLVASTATAMAAQTQTLTTQFTDRLALLEKVQYENKGKSGLIDPMLQELVTEVRSLRESRSVSTGTVTGISSSWVMLIGLVSLVSVLLGIYGTLKGPSTTNTSPPATFQPVK